jgi:hypothetical protein
MVDPEQKLSGLPLANVPDDLVFDRAWSSILVNRALKHIRAEYCRLRKELAYDEFLVLLKNGVDKGDFPQISKRLGVSEGNARVMWLRFRATFLDNIRSEVEQTLSGDQNLEEELRHLMSVWARCA